MKILLKKKEKNNIKNYIKFMIKKIIKKTYYKTNYDFLHENHFISETSYAMKNTNSSAY